MRSRTLILAFEIGLFTIGCGGSDPTTSDGGTGGNNTGSGVSQSSSTSSGGLGGDASEGGGSGGVGTGGTSSGSGVPGALCAPIPACDAAPPAPGDAVDWNHTASILITATGAPNHRGRDLYLNPGDPQWAIAKFSYGLADKDIKDEQVDVYLLRDCGEEWEFLGTTSTTEEDSHPKVEGVDDTGGRAYFEIPADRALGLGRHRIHMVVRGDLSSTDLFIEVVPPGTPMFVSDVDGTLTGSETEEFTALFLGKLPDVHPSAADAFHALAAKGYHPMYVTARPEWLVGRTREFLDTNGFPPGVVHTTLGLTGAVGGGASDYKTGELTLLAGKGMVPAWAFGNTATDATAYESAAVQPVSQRVFYQFDDSVYGGRRIEDYSELLTEIDALPSLCQ